MRRLATVLLVSFAGTAASADAQERRTVRDPAGATAWTAELRAADARGQTCVVLRRGRTGKGRFCSRLTSRTVFQYTTRRETGGDDPRRWRTILVVALAPNVERATLRTTDGVATYRRGRGPRVLLAVLAGDVEQGLLRATVRSGSRTRTATAGTVPRVTVPDPRGDDPWRLARDAGGTRACVRWERVRRFTTPARTVRARGPERCAPRGGGAPSPSPSPRRSTSASSSPAWPPTACARSSCAARPARRGWRATRTPARSSPSSPATSTRRRCASSRGCSTGAGHRPLERADAR
jgi:hypothetical protein